jgi:DNA-directed RNA polymerase specialized sigma24 family protein
MPDSITPEADDAAAYEYYFSTLSTLAASHFETSAADAEGLAHEVLLASLRHRLNEANAEGWLFGAITCAVHNHRGRVE